MLKNLGYRDLKGKFTDEDKKRVADSHSVSTDEDAVWLIDYWCNKDIAGLIKMPFSRHWIMHIEAMCDPPRTGSTESFLEAIKKLNPKKVIYVSCDPHTLTRDLKVLLPNYNVSNGCLVDMFVGTYHVESVCLLTKRNGNAKYN